ncbi:MAG TPA: HD domain-containing phosphohydrolase [Myxococcota bacterium]|jgi:putative nucleotidyltransferase with HDIG domain
MGGGSRHSLFSQRFDRAVLASYFLGGVLPIAALFWLVREFVLPHYPVGSLEYLGWAGGVASLAVLSLSVYFALRRISDITLSRMRADNQRLASLLSASRTLASAREPDAIFASALERVRELIGGPHAAILLSQEPEKPLELRNSSAEARPWFEAQSAGLLELAAESETSGSPAIQIVGARARIALPFRASHTTRGALLVEASHAALGAEAIDALSTIAGMTGTALQRSDLEDAQRNFFAHVTELLVTALDGHVVGRRGHGSNVARFANRIAHELKLDAPRSERLHFGAMLHDLGMLKIDPARHLDLKSVRAHPVVGARMLSRIRLWEPLAPIVLHHHEHWDGQGYPEGRSGEGIPLEARIICLADAVDAMLRGEGARPARSPDEIVKELQRCRGTHFDPALVDAFLTLHGRGESGMESL